ncbi:MULTISPECIES: hypothetical protein [Sutcliffiella]|uniref:Uncharacterized protein n=1 Tax=Sutcliffiella cohnii TaxID=33932 RepID=A0A223KNN8_9BACI|nr:MULTISPECIES: hypothetical protein [Sutcliffiella]AST90984.1 hypothetical protein BC6307_06665 [Sutcliffiella cohnii]WBL16781.1 hypothetical protein O1A01_09155 [Sutcliffiella sp. NC1]
MRKGEVEEVALKVGGFSQTKKLVIGALLGAIAFMLQSAGIFAGIGYLFSMMSTAPLVIASLLSLKIGTMTYFVTIFLLAMFQPSELWVFPFTTGLLGLALGVGLKYLRRSIFIIPFAAICLSLGIIILLYGFKFPILGPSVTTNFSGVVILAILVFSLLYSWLWQFVSLFIIKLLKRILPRP